MRKFKGSIRTDVCGSDCEFNFELEDDATQETIDIAASDAAFNFIEWNFEEIKNES